LQRIEAERKKTIPTFNPYYKKEDAKHIGILEPNINLVKTFVIPACIVERLYCEDPDQFKETGVRIYCSDHIRDRQAFKHLYGHLTCKGILSSESRYTVIDIFNSDCNVIISHQHLCEYNYLYLDALYYGLPLVHNSPRLKEYGYYYPDFDVAKGFKALQRALNEHDKNIASYNEKAQDLLFKHSVKNPDNIKGYKKIFRKNRCF